MQGSLSVERMCQLARVSRAGFYRSLQEQMPVEEDMEVRSAIQTVALEHRRRYGYRRITAELRRRGMLVNQGAKNIEYWLGVTPDKAIMRRALEEVFGI